MIKIQIYGKKDSRVIDCSVVPTNNVATEGADVAMYGNIVGGGKSKR